MCFLCYNKLIGEEKLDKLAQNLFNILYDYNPTDNYRVVTFDDIRQQWEGMTNIVQLLDELMDGGYIDIKYRDDNNVCYLCLKKPQTHVAKVVVDKQGDVVIAKNKTNLILPAIVSFASGFLGAFLAVVIGLLILV